jgi:hypothetical protein
MLRPTIAEIDVSSGSNSEIEELHNIGERPEDGEIVSICSDLSALSEEEKNRKQKLIQLKSA